MHYLTDVLKTLGRAVRRGGRPLAVAARRYPLLFIAVGFSIGILATSLIVAHNLNRKAASAFKPEKVLPAPVSQPTAASTSFTLDQLKRYDGRDGHDCYVAVKGTVYAIKNQYWQNGKHTPSDGQAYCGADMTDVIGKSPHGESVLGELPVVGKLAQ